MHVCLFVDESGVIWDKRKIIRSLAGQPEKKSEQCREDFGFLLFKLRLLLKMISSPY